MTDKASEWAANRVRKDRLEGDLRRLQTGFESLGEGWKDYFASFSALLASKANLAEARSDTFQVVFRLWIDSPLSDVGSSSESEAADTALARDHWLAEARRGQEIALEQLEKLGNEKIQKGRQDPDPDGKVAALVTQLESSRILQRSVLGYRQERIQLAGPLLTTKEADKTLGELLRMKREAEVGQIEESRAKGRQEGISDSAEDARQKEYEVTRKWENEQLKRQLKQREREIALLQVANEEAKRDLQEEVKLLRKELELGRDASSREKAAELEADYEKRLAEVERGKTQLEKELAESRERVAEAKERIAALEAKVKIKELPAPIRGRIATLSKPGYWKPVMRTDGYFGFEGDARYDSKQPHSLSQLISVGALDDSPRGLFILFAILADRSDEDRNREPNGFEFRRGHGNGALEYAAGGSFWDHVERERNGYARALDADPAKRDRIKEIQKALNEWGDALVTNKVLQP